MAVAIVVASATAAADPASETAQALAVGHAALEQYDAGAWQAALEQFRKADELAHSPVFTLYTARCQRELGRLLEARRSFQGVVDEPLAEDAPATWRKAVADAKRELAAMKRQIPRVAVGVEGPGAASALVSLNGRTLSRAELDTPIEVDPGTITAVARVGDRQVRQELSLGAGSDEHVVLRFHATEPKTAPAPLPAPARDAAAPESRSYLAPGIAFGVGAAGIVAGTVLGLVASSRASEVKSRCQGDSCLASDADAGASATRLANASTVAFVIGGVGIGGGVTLLVLPSGGAPQHGATAHFTAAF